MQGSPIRIQSEAAKFLYDNLVSDNASEGHLLLTSDFIREHAEKVVVGNSGIRVGGLT